MAEIGAGDARGLPPLNWEGLVCVVTGASSGFGRAVAKELAAGGATVVVAARRRQLLEELVAEMGGPPHSFIPCDVSDLAQVRAMADALRQRAGHVDVLVNNAGIPSSGPIGIATSEEMERVIRINLLGAIYCTRELLPLLEAAPRRSRTPVIVNVASMAGRIPVPRSPDYTASKFGLVGFTESAWHDLSARGIRAMVVNPGMADTEGFPMTKVRANPLTAWAVMDSERVARALVRGIERGAFEVRVQWWLHPIYHLTVWAGPLRRFLSKLVRSQIRGNF